MASDLHHILFDWCGQSPQRSDQFARSEILKEKKP
jgi:hypothetical protein